MKEMLSWAKQMSYLEIFDSLMLFIIAVSIMKMAFNKASKEKLPEATLFANPITNERDYRGMRIPLYVTSSKLDAGFDEVEDNSMSNEKGISDSLISEIEHQLDLAEEADQQRLQASRKGQTDDPCAYLGCGRIGLRDRGRIKWLRPRYVSELSVYKSLMSLPGPLRSGGRWQWQQGVRCEDVEVWVSENNEVD